MYGYIYLIVNKVNGKTYVGKHKSHPRKDWQNDGYMGSGTTLHNAKEKYGIENFEKFLIQYCDENNINEQEIFWIAHYRALGKAEYNQTDGGDGVMNPSLAARRKMSLAKKGKPSPKKGCHISEETKKKISESQKGKTKKGHPWTPEMYTKLNGRKRSAEARKRMSDSHKGQTPWNKGKQLSKEHKGKISKVHKGKHWKLVDGKRVWF